MYRLVQEDAECSNQYINVQGETLALKEVKKK